MKNANFRILVLFILFVGCLKKDDGELVKSDDFKLLNVDIEKLTRHSCLDNFAKKVSFIKIEDKNGFIIGSPTNILLMKGYIVINDQDNSGKVYVVNYSGELITTIGKQGRGPGEYLSIQEIRVDQHDNSIYILESAGKIHHYTIADDYLGTIKLEGIYPKSFIPYNVEDFLIYPQHIKENISGDVLERLLHVNEKGKIVNKLLITKTIDRPINYSFPSCIWQDNDKIFVSSAYINDVVKLTQKGTIEIAYTIKFIGAQSPLNPFNIPFDENQKFYEDNNNAYYLERFMTSDSLKTFRFIHGKKLGFYLNIKNKVIITNSFIDKFQTLILPISLHENKLICVIDPSYIGPVDKENISKRDILYGINYLKGDYVNPIIAIYEF